MAWLNVLTRLVDALVKKANDNQNEWDRYIDSVLFAYRTAKQERTKMTPFFIMHLRDANFGLDMNQLTHQPDDEEELQQKIQALITIKFNIRKATGKIYTDKYLAMTH